MYKKGILQSTNRREWRTISGDANLGNRVVTVSVAQMLVHAVGTAYTEPTNRALVLVMTLALMLCELADIGVDLLANVACERGGWGGVCLAKVVAKRLDRDIRETAMMIRALDRPVGRMGSDMFINLLDGHQGSVTAHRERSPPMVSREVSLEAVYGRERVPARCAAEWRGGIGGL
jgi:hypothetical protein